MTGETAEAGEGAEATARSTEAAPGTTEATLLEALLEAGLIGILWAAEAAARLLHAGLEARLVSILARLDAAILGEALLEACLEGVLAHLAHTREAAAHHLLHLGQLLLHLSQLLLHHSHLVELAGELALSGESAALLLLREVVELLPVIAATVLLFTKKFAE